jgi:3-dehydroquinate synthase class II
VRAVTKSANSVQTRDVPLSHEQPRVQAVRRVAGKADRQWWFDARGLEDGDVSVLDAAYQSGCAAILMTVGQQQRVMTAKHRIVYVERLEQLGQLAADVAVLTPDEEILAQARQAGRKAGCYLRVENLETQFARCREVVQRAYDFVAIEMHHATYIPFELLMAEAEALPTRILRVVPIQGLQGTVEEVHQAINAFGTMENGVDVLFRSSSAWQIKRLDARIEEVLRGQMHLVEAEVVAVEHVGLGHRVCVDTTTLMTAEEGMIIGSTGWGGIFVCSETHYLPHMNLREFRVNAGGVHSYVWGPNNVALYLSELQSGSRALAVDVEGRTRVVTVGRVKIERRPLLLIRARLHPNDPPEAHVKTFLQNDWHVRVMGADRKVRNSTLVRPGDRLLAFADEPGRHTGLRVSESIVEK